MLVIHSRLSTRTTCLSSQGHHLAPNGRVLVGHHPFRTSQPSCRQVCRCNPSNPPTQEELLQQILGKVTEQGRALTEQGRALKSLETELGFITELQAAPTVARCFGQHYSEGLNINDAPGLAAVVGAEASLLVRAATYKMQGLKSATAVLCKKAPEKKKLLSAIAQGNWVLWLQIVGGMPKGHSLGPLVSYVSKLNKLMQGQSPEQLLMEDGATFMLMATSLSMGTAQDEVQADYGEPSSSAAARDQFMTVRAGEIKRSSKARSEARAQLIKLARLLGWAAAVGVPQPCQHLQVEGSIFTVKNGSPAGQHRYAHQRIFRAGHGGQVRMGVSVTFTYFMVRPNHLVKG